ncbi:MAG: ankyrin repeat domain-containing protein, partial [Gammaproteobacteria bacterium]|nr:ankyrin repeat domain-containing protein [Gammaproteobacteria bacterium]
RERVLYSLVLANDLAGIKSFIKKSKDQKAALSNTLFYAAETGQRPALSYAISRKVEINQQDNEGRTALMVAAAYGRTKAVESLLNNKAEVNRKDKQGRSAVSWAFGTKRTLPILKLLHSHGADLEVLDKSGERPIFYAVRDGDRKALAFLLSAKVDFHRPNAEGDLAINLALRQKQIVILKDLLNAYAQAGKLKEQSSELAYLAVFTNNKAVTRTLLAAGIDFTQGAQGELSPVELAQQTKAASFLAQLKTAGVDVSAGRVAQTEQKKTQVSAEQKEIVKRLSSDKDLSLSPMLKAAWEGDEKQLRKRHQAGESISLPDKNGLTPLMMAVSRGHVQTVKLLLELGAEVNNYTYKNNSLLGMAVAGDKVEIVQLLMAKKARPTPSENLLAVAAYNNSLEMIESLIATLPAKLVRDEDLEFIFKSALTQGERLPELLVEYVLRSDQVRLKKILLLAAQYGELNLFAQIQKKHPKLLEHDFVKRDVLLSAIQFANADAVAYFLKKIDGDEMEDEAKNSLLHIAAARGDAQVLSQVLKIQKDVDRENLEFYTPLMLAAEAGHVEIVRILLERGADTRIKNRQNETAEDLAALYGYPEVLTLLRKAAEK